MKEKFILDKSKLENRLKELAETQYTGEVMFGAMCYCPAIPEDVDYICPVCKKSTKHSSFKFEPNDINDIRKVVNELKEEGYDVILDESEYCQYCNSDGKIDEPMAILKIRFDKNDDYHTARADFKDFRYLCAFLIGRDHILNYRDATESLHESIDIIHKMTGLGSVEYKKWLDSIENSKSGEYRDVKWRLDIYDSDDDSEDDLE